MGLDSRAALFTVYLVTAHYDKY